MKKRKLRAFAYIIKGLDFRRIYTAYIYKFPPFFPEIVRKVRWGQNDLDLPHYNEI